MNIKQRDEKGKEIKQNNNILIIKKPKSLVDRRKKQSYSSVHKENIIL